MLIFFGSRRSKGGIVMFGKLMDFMLKKINIFIFEKLTKQLDQIFGWPSVPYHHFIFNRKRKTA